LCDSTVLRSSSSFNFLSVSRGSFLQNVVVYAWSQPGGSFQAWIPEVSEFYLWNVPLSVLRVELRR
jgi:hypothetical protein